MKIFLVLLIIISFSFSENIRVSSFSNNSKYEKITINIISQKLIEIKEYFDFNTLTVNALLFDSDDKFYNNTGLPDHIPGAYISSKNTIYLKTPLTTKMTIKQYKNLIHHEMIHSIQNQIVPLVLFPDWFNEGLADYFSGNFTLPQRIRLSKILLTKRYLELDDMVFFHHRYRQPAADRYILSSSVIEFLKINFSEDIFQQIFYDVEKTKNFDQSILNVTGLTIEQINFFWHKYLKDRYDKLFLLDLQYIIWLFLPFLFIFSFTVKQFINQMIIKRWKYEKLEEQINNIFTDQFHIA